MDLMPRWMQMIAEGGMIDMDIKLTYTKTLTQAYTGTLASLWTNEILPQLTFGNYHKFCIVEIVGNTSTAGGKGNMLGFSLATNPANQSSTERTGWMIRSDFTNIRGFDVTNSFPVSSGATIKIYEATV